mmetsp:Transcript_2131/g.4896  ORF Transcript_2131/g.4896 Transcript_2131/m.4896 type:complete len:80 (-) Transcript_2131:910-1149(-)
MAEFPAMGIEVMRSMRLCLAACRYSAKPLGAAALDRRLWRRRLSKRSPKLQPDMWNVDTSGRIRILEELMWHLRILAAN